MANKVLIDIMDEKNHDAGTKARNDVTWILNDMGFDTTVMFNRTHGNIRRMLEIGLATIRIRNNLSLDEMIVIQYPYQPNIMRFMINRIYRIKKNYNIRLVILVHDIIYLRNENYISKSIEDMKHIEIDIFNMADFLIIHNSAMKRELMNAGVTTTMYELNLFDYIYHGKEALNIEFDKPTIVFAGNLSPEKSGFIYSYGGNDKVSFNLYGTNPGKLAPCFDYIGSFPPNELIGSLKGNYGLVWDGPSSHNCEGNYGEYLKYNSPHKLSLYLAAGLPVIVWKQAAVASYVVENGYGISISSLEELNTIPGFGSQNYQSMVTNVARIKSRLCNGIMLRSAINSIDRRDIL